ncbi:MAG: PHP domain-containing protein [archaeon GB-1867-005]|nr:PHP domain-containing protein [Candidatus Culexmicrobium cathedralense]
MKIKADLHIHSTYSGDSVLTVDEIVKYYSENNFGAIAVTDHDSFKGAIEARKLAKRMNLNLIVILGAEVETNDGEIIVLTDKELPFLPVNAEKLIEEVRKNGGVTYAPHPFDFKRRSLGDKVFQLNGLDAIEVLNANSSKRANRLALRAAKILNKPGLANSDAHADWQLGKAYTILEVGELSVKEVLNAIKNGKIAGRKIK